MRLITLLTDWQKDDYYKAVTKAAVLSQVSDVQFIDISHQVNTYHIYQAAFLLNSAIHQFPKDTIHFFGIQTVSSEQQKIVIGQFNGQYIIANDNGIFDALNIKFDDLIEVPAQLTSFPIAEIFAPIAVKIINGTALSEIGQKIEKGQSFRIVHPSIEEDRITCPVTYIDSYGNLILNIQKSLFEEERQSRRFDILINSFKYKTNQIHDHYNQVPKSEIFAIFNSAGWLEVGMRMANISQVLNLSEKSNIIIKFYED